MATPTSTDPAPFPSTPAHEPRPSSSIDDDRQPLLEPDGEDTPDRSAPPFVLSKLSKYCLTLWFLVELSGNVLMVPLISLFEKAICETYYHTHGSLLLDHWSPVDEGSCKIAPIQRELAKLRGWKAFFENIAAILLAIPVGHVADRISHVKVLAFILSGMLAALLWTIFVATHPTLPLRLVWGTSIFYLCGGGYYASEMMVSLMTASSCPEEHRTRTFYYAYTVFISTELIGPPIASWTSRYSLWIPLAIGAALLVLCYPVLAVMPATPKARANLSVPEADPHIQDSNTQKGSQAIFHRFWRIKANNPIFSLFENRKMLLALPIFFVGVFRGVSLRVLLQYTSVRFGWKLSQVRNPQLCLLSSRSIH
ncbi:MAG: hypothetical protein Q9161_006378 [Pseudevernia consocians]